MKSFSLERPHCHIITGSTPEIDSFVFKLRFDEASHTAVRLLRGSNMQALDSFYNEISAALQFPLYFGRNFAALDECFADLEWIPANAYTLIFSDALLILKRESVETVNAFFSLLARVADEWAEAGSDGLGHGRRVAFHVIFHCDITEYDKLSARIERAIGYKVPQIRL